MASREYCSNVSLELEKWSEKLHKLSGEIDRISTGDKYRLLSQIEGLHMIMAELDDRLCSLMQSCPTTEVEDVVGGAGAGAFGDPEFNWKIREQFDYDFGG